MGCDGIVVGLAVCDGAFSVELGGSIAGDDDGVGRWEGGDMFGGE